MELTKILLPLYLLFAIIRSLPPGGRRVVPVPLEPGPVAPTTPVSWRSRLILHGKGPAALLFTLVLWYCGQVYTQQLSYARETAERQWQGYRDVIEGASDIVGTLDFRERPPAPIDNIVEPPAAPLGPLVRNFEKLYWARVGLVTAPAVSVCMKNLHNILMDDVRKWANIQDHVEEIQRLRTKIYETSTVLRDDYRNKANSIVPWIVLSSDFLAFESASGECPAGRGGGR